MGKGVTVADAAIAISADLKGFVADLTKQGGAAADTAGQSIGQRLSTSMSASLKTLAGGAIGAFLGAGFASAMNGALQLNELAGEYQVQTGASAAEAKAFSGVLNDLFKNAHQGYDEISQTLIGLKTHFDMAGEAAATLGASILDFAEIAGGGGAAAVERLNSLVKTGVIAEADMTAIMEKLTVAHQRWGININETLDSLTKFAPAMNALGLSTDEAIAWMSIFNKAGVDAQRVTMGFNTAIKQVKTPEEFKALVATIAATPDDMTRAKLAVDLFGQRAGAALANMLRPGSESVAEMASIIGTDYTGAVEKAGAVNDNTFGGRALLMLHQFQGALAGMGTNMGELLLVGALVGPQLTSAIGAGLGGLSSVFIPKIVAAIAATTVPAVVASTAVGEAMGLATGISATAKQWETIIAGQAPGAGILAAAGAAGQKVGAAFGTGFGIAAKVAIPLLLAELGVQAFQHMADDAAAADAAAKAGLTSTEQLAFNISRMNEAFQATELVRQKLSRTDYEAALASALLKISGAAVGATADLSATGTAGMALGGAPAAAVAAVGTAATGAATGISRMGQTMVFAGSAMETIVAKARGVPAALAAALDSRTAYDAANRFASRLAAQMADKRTFAQAASDAVGAYAGGLASGTATVESGVAALINASLSPEKKALAVHLLYGILSSRAIAAGISQGSGAAYDAAIQTVQGALSAMNSLIGPAATSGMMAGVGWFNAFTNGMSGGEGKSGLAAVRAPKITATAKDLADIKALGKQFNDAFGAGVGGGGGGGASTSIKDLAAELKEKLGQAFDTLRTKATAYFDKLHDRTVKAIEDARDLKNAQLDAQLGALGGKIDEARRKMRDESDARRLAELQAAIGQEGQTPEEAARAQQELADFKEELRIQALEDEAQVLQDQRDANDKAAEEQLRAEEQRAADQKTNFENDLAKLQEHLSKVHHTNKQAQDELAKLLKSYGLDYRSIGKTLGEELAAGLIASGKAVEEAAKGLAKIIADYLKTHSPAKLGPLAFDQVASGQKIGLDIAQGLGLSALAAGAAASSVAAAVLSAFHGPLPAGTGPAFPGSASAFATPGWSTPGNPVTDRPLAPNGMSWDQFYWGPDAQDRNISDYAAAPMSIPPGETFTPAPISFPITVAGGIADPNGTLVRDIVEQIGPAFIRWCRDSGYLAPGVRFTIG